MSEEMENTRRARRWCVRPLHQNRFVDGAFRRQLIPMRVLDPELHFNYFRMTKEQFDEILSLVRTKIEYKPTNKLPISAEERLAITLRYTYLGM